MRIAFVMPAYEEEFLLAQAASEVAARVDRLVIVDDGSQDGTFAQGVNVCERFPGVVEILQHPRNRGVGAAVVTGIRHLLLDDTVEAIGLISSDGQCDPGLIPRLRFSLEHDPIDVVKGSRFLHRESLDAMPRFRYWGNRGVSFVIRNLLGYRGMSDILHGYLLGRVEVFRSMELDRIADGYDLENTMMSEFRRLRCRFALLPSPSRYGRERSKIVYSRQIPRTIKWMAKIAVRRLTHGPALERMAVGLWLAGVPMVVLGALTLQPGLTLGGLAAVGISRLLVGATSPEVRVHR